MEVLARSSCFAEKLLANADRGRDPSANARDLIDLAFMAAYWPEEDQRTGMATAQSAYPRASRLCQTRMITAASRSIRYRNT